MGDKRRALFERAREGLRRLLSRPAAACFILGHGVAVSDRPRCRLCGEKFELPARSGETYRLAAPLVAESTRASEGDWLFFGSRVLVAMVNVRLTALLRDCVTHFGDQVLVAMARHDGGRREPLLFCKPCGRGLLDRVNANGQPHYGWDWLAELHPGDRWTRLSLFARLARLTQRQPIAS